MKKTFIVGVLFIISFGIVYSIGEFFFSSEDPTTGQGGSMLQSAVTFGGINYLSIFVYILIAMAVTAIVYFSAKSRRSN